MNLIKVASIVSLFSSASVAALHFPSIPAVESDAEADCGEKSDECGRDDTCCAGLKCEESADDFFICVDHDQAPGIPAVKKTIGAWGCAERLDGCTDDTSCCGEMECTAISDDEDEDWNICMDPEGGQKHPCC